MLDKKYNHLEVEKNKYNNWKEKGYFESGDLSKKPYCIVIPPPNVTGKLHLGHAWNTTLQDINGDGLVDLVGKSDNIDYFIVKFPTRMIDFVPRCCNFVPYDDSKLSDMIRIYNEFSKGRNLLLKRFDDRHYKNPQKKIYICYK